MKNHLRLFMKNVYNKENPNMNTSSISPVPALLKGRILPILERKKMAEEYENAKRAQELLDAGITVIPVDWVTPSILKKIKIRFDSTVQSFPEYIHPVPNNDYVMGGFNALNNPASFHNQFVRDMRMWAMWSVVPVLRHLSNGRKLEQDIDRMLLRPKGQSPSAESFHRDEAARALANDDMFGGWWNIDADTQYFSVVLGTHKEVSKHRGFASIKGVQAKEYNKMKVKIAIPPGHIMIFYEKMVHEVLATKAKKDMIRLFLGWRLTHSDECLVGNKNLEDTLSKQGLCEIKSGQIPGMYAKLHWTNWRPQIEKFSKHIRPECLEVREVKSGKDKGKQYIIVQQHMKSLEELGLSKYQKYYMHEKSILKPNTEWEIYPPCVSSFDHASIYSKKKLRMI